MTQGETFGAALAVVASIISNLGVNIQKYSHADEARAPLHEQRAYVQRPMWWLGLALVIFGSFGDFAAFGFATQSLVAALGGGSTLVANVFTAYFLNRETLYASDLGGVLFVIMGVVIIACIAEPNVEYPLPELEKRFVRTGFVVYIVAVGVCTVSMLATIKGSMAHRLKNQVYWSNRRQKQRMTKMEERMLRMEQRMLSMEQKLLENAHAPGGRALTDGVLPGSKASASLNHTRRLKDAEDGGVETGVMYHSRVPYYYAICSGIVGAITVLLAKCSAVMIALSLKGDNQFKYALTYVFLGGMFVCIIVQTHFLNLATSLGDIMTVFPIFQACWITFSVVGGAVFYESDKAFTRTEWVLYPTALACIGLGVALLVQHGSTAAARGAAASSGKPGGSRSKQSGVDYGLLEDDEICLITDASMSSPLLPADSLDQEGYLHLDSDS